MPVFYKLGVAKVEKINASLGVLIWNLKDCRLSRSMANMGYYEKV